jgi:hypothetical protein
LASYRNRDAAWALAIFLARFWSVPGRVAGSFPIDRRDLAEHPELGLTEAKVRGAIRTLEEVGFLDRALAPAGSRYRATEEGLHRKPILFVFGSEYAPDFLAANRRAAATRGAHSRGRRPAALANALRPSTATLEARPLNSPKNKSVAVPSMSLGELRTGKKIGLPPKAFEPDPKLEAALERLRSGVFGKAGTLGGDR